MQLVRGCNDKDGKKTPGDAGGNKPANKLAG